MAVTREKSQLMSASEIDRTLVRLAHEILERTESGIRVLICEDNREVATILVAMLRAEGWISDIAGSAQAARELLAQHDYRLLLLDLSLPDADGLQFLRQP